MSGRRWIAACLVFLASCAGRGVDTTRRVEDASTDVGLQRAWIRSMADLEALDLSPVDPTDEESVAALEDIGGVVSEGLSQNQYVLVFDGGPRKAWIRNGEGMSLVGLHRIDAPWDRHSPTCSTWVPLDGQGGGAGGRGALRTATRGICGGIAALHSLLALEVVSRDDVVEGDHFKEGPLRQIQGPDRDRMSERRLRAVHESAGLNRCEARGAGDGFVTTNRQGLERFNAELAGRVNDPDHDWDCTIFVRRREGGRWTLAHFEHVRSVRGQGGTTTIETTNGLDQGNQTDAVPASPGTNTWTSEPGGDPPFSLTGSTHPKGSDYVRILPEPNRVKFLCCRRPDP